MNTAQTQGGLFSLKDDLSHSVLKKYLFELPLPQASGLSSVFPG